MVSLVHLGGPSGTFVINTTSYRWAFPLFVFRLFASLHWLSSSLNTSLWTEDMVICGLPVVFFRMGFEWRP